MIYSAKRVSLQNEEQLTICKTSFNSYLFIKLSEVLTGVLFGQNLARSDLEILFYDDE